MNHKLLVGELVRLAAVTEAWPEAIARWSRSSETFRLMGSEATSPFSPQASKKWYEKEVLELPPNNYLFEIHSLQDDHLIGDIGLDGIRWMHGDCFVGIGIGERNYWGRGYGTDAMRVILRFAFRELNLHRVTLNVFSYNPRAIRSYEKVGFSHEGCVRQALNRAGQRWDVIYMGILRSEWEHLYADQ